MRNKSISGAEFIILKMWALKPRCRQIILLFNAQHKKTYSLEFIEMSPILININTIKSAGKSEMIISGILWLREALR